MGKARKFSVLMIGADPISMAEVHEQPPGWSTDEILASVSAQRDELITRGHDAHMCLVRADTTSYPPVEDLIGARDWDIIAIGTGIHVVPQFLGALEHVVNVLVSHAAEATVTPHIAFSTSFTTVADAVLDRIRGIDGAN